MLFDEGYLDSRTLNRTPIVPSCLNIIIFDTKEGKPVRKRGERQMSKSLRSMTKAEESKAIERRLREKRGGLGYLAAVDAKKKAR